LFSQQTVFVTEFILISSFYFYMVFSLTESFNDDKRYFCGQLKYPNRLVESVGCSPVTICKPEKSLLSIIWVSCVRYESTTCAIEGDNRWKAR
jgi:hypothetical protein